MKKIRFEKAHPKRTPTATNYKLTKDNDVECVEESLYRSMIGRLLYLTASHPDIPYIVDACARYHLLHDFLILLSTE